jgi:hypothetical protein
LDHAVPHLNPEYGSRDPWRWITTGELVEATRKLVPQLPPQLAGIVGVPRSGMICGHNPMGDDDPAYESWLVDAPPLWLPRFVPAPLIITYRCERHRSVTEAWLRRWGCRWERLVMAPFDDWRQRDRSLSPVDFKAQHLAESPCVGLVESHDWIAQGVHSATGKVVIALESDRVYQQPKGVDR